MSCSGLSRGNLTPWPPSRHGKGEHSDRPQPMGSPPRIGEGSGRGSSRRSEPRGSHGAERGGSSGTRICTRVIMVCISTASIHSRQGCCYRMASAAGSAAPPDLRFSWMRARREENQAAAEPEARRHALHSQTSPPCVPPPRGGEGGGGERSRGGSGNRGLRAPARAEPPSANPAGRPRAGQRRRSRSAFDSRWKNARTSVHGSGRCSFGSASASASRK